MEHKEYTQFPDQELLDESKKMKSFSITNALLIGFLVGVIFFSIVKNSWGMLTLIPLYFMSLFKWRSQSKLKPVIFLLKVK